MKIAKIIAYILSQLLRLWITASAAMMMYIPMSALAYAERGYKAVGGEMLPVAIVAVAVWYGLGWLMREWCKDMIGGGYGEYVAWQARATIEQQQNFRRARQVAEIRRKRGKKK